MNFSPIVGLFGHRQVGKTTLSEGLAKRYVTLDQNASLQMALISPDDFLATNANQPLVIDECQLAPPLFPALKESVRMNKKPGRFLLTGSVRFSSRKAIRESLTGRIINWELLPMDLSEAHSKPLPNSIPKLLERGLSVPLAEASYFSPQTFASSLLCGGLPGMFAIRDEAIRRQRFETQLETILERDLRLLIQTTIEYRNLRHLLSILASKQGSPLELAEVSRSSRISPPALRRILSALESMFVLRFIQTSGTRKRPVFFFEDQGEATHLAGESHDALLNMVRFMHNQLRHQWIYRPNLQAQFFQFRNRGGAFVPLAIRAKLGVLGLIPMLSESPGKHELASAQSFLSAFREARCLFVHQGIKDHLLGHNLRIIPLSKLV